MSQLLDNPRVCFVCHEEVTDMKKAGYVSGYGLPIVGHTACLNGLNDAIQERRQPKTVRKAEPMQKHDRTTVNRAIVESALQNLVNDFIDSGQQPTGVMAL